MLDRLQLAYPELIGIFTVLPGTTADQDQSGACYIATHACVIPSGVVHKTTRCVLPVCVRCHIYCLCHVVWGSIKEKLAPQLWSIITRQQPMHAEHACNRMAATSRLAKYFHVDPPQ